MIAMTMLPDMVVEVWKGLWRWRERGCGDSDGVGDESLGRFMREMCFLSVYSSGRVELVNLKASIESWSRLDLLQRPSSSIGVVVDEMGSD
jgi:hypothetical protein